MRMEDPIPTFSYLVQQLAKKHTKLGYIHLVEPRVNGQFDREVPPDEVRRSLSNYLDVVLTAIQSNDFIRTIWAPRPLISAGGYNRDLALEVADQKGDLIAFGRHFISNVRSDYLIQCVRTC